MSETKKSTFEQQLFKTADKLRKNIDAAEYKYVVLGLVFIKYISETFNELYEQLEADKWVFPLRVVRMMWLIKNYQQTKRLITN